MTRSLLALLLLLVACSPEPIVGSEPWRAPPQIRVAVIAQSDGVHLQTLKGDAAVRTEVNVDERTELWIHSYRADTLRAAFPGLAGESVDEILARVVPVLGPGETAPPADETLSAELGQDAPNPIEYTARSWADFTARAPLTFHLQVALDDVCGRATLTEVTAPAAVSLTNVTAAGPDRALVTAMLREGTDRTVQLYAVENGAFRKLAARTERGPTQGPIAWDASTQSVWAIDASDALFRFDGAGDPLPVPAPPSDPDVLPRAAQVGVGRDGTVMATFPLHIDEPPRFVGYSPSLFRLLDNGTWDFARVRDGGYRMFDVSRRERLLAWYRCWVYLFRDPADSSGWKQSVLDARCPTMEIADINAVDLDDDGGVVAGDLAFVYLRDEATGEWTNASDGLPREDFKIAATVGGARAVVGSGTGKLFFRTGPHWCPVETPAGVVFTRIAALPQGNAVYLIPSTNDSLMRLELP